MTQKFFSTLFTNELKKIGEELEEDQNGFSKSSGTREGIMSLTTIIERKWKKKNALSAIHQLGKDNAD